MRVGNNQMVKFVVALASVHQKSKLSQIIDKWIGAFMSFDNILYIQIHRWIICMTNKSLEIISDWKIIICTNYYD